MGALLRFKKETGREASTLMGTDLEGNITFLWCCIVSACKHDGKEFGLSLMDFADAIDADDVNGWAKQLDQTGGSGGSGSDGEKKNAPEIEELLGFALGCMGMRLDDWCRLDVDDFNSTVKAWSEMRDGDEHGRWNRMRILASIVIQPHVKGKMKPERMLPLPWDKGRDRQADKRKAETLSKEAQKERLEELLKRKGVAIQ